MHLQGVAVVAQVSRTESSPALAASGNSFALFSETIVRNAVTARVSFAHSHPSWHMPAQRHSGQSQYSWT